MIIKYLVIILTSMFLISCDDGENSIIDKKYKVGVISGVDFFEPTIAGFKAEMTVYGYREGKNIQYDIRKAKGNDEEMKRISEDFVAQKVDLIFTTTNGAAIAAKNAAVSSGIPIVFTLVMAPVETGVVDSLIEPSGNITGVRNPLGEFIGKRLEILKQLAPSVKKILILNNPNYPTVPIAFKGLRAGAKYLDLQLIDVPVTKPAQVTHYLSNVKKGEFDAILIMPDPIVQVEESLKAIHMAAKRFNIPIVANTPKQAENGALFSYLADSYETGKEAAQLANNVLAKRIRHSLPVISSEPQLILNLNVARKLNLKVDESLIALSQRVID